MSSAPLGITVRDDVSSDEELDDDDPTSSLDSSGDVHDVVSYDLATSSFSGNTSFASSPFFGANGGFLHGDDHGFGDEADTLDYQFGGANGTFGVYSSNDFGGRMNGFGDFSNGFGDEDAGYGTNGGGYNVLETIEEGEEESNDEYDREQVEYYDNVDYGSQGEYSGYSSLESPALPCSPLHASDSTAGSAADATFVVGGCDVAGDGAGGLDMSSSEHDVESSIKLDQPTAIGVRTVSPVGGHHEPAGLPSVSSHGPCFYNGAGVTSLHSNVITTPPNVITTLHNVITTPPNVIKSPPNVITTPSNVITTLSEVIATSPSVITTQNNIATSLESNDTSLNSDDVSLLCNDTSLKSDDVSLPSNHVSLPHDDVSSPSNYLSLTSNLTSSQSNYTSLQSNDGSVNSNLASLEYQENSLKHNKTALKPNGVEALSEEVELDHTTLKYLVKEASDLENEEVNQLESNHGQTVKFTEYLHSLTYLTCQNRVTGAIEHEGALQFHASAEGSATRPLFKSSATSQPFSDECWDHASPQAQGWSQGLGLRTFEECFVEDDEDHDEWVKIEDGDDDETAGSSSRGCEESRQFEGFVEPDCEPSRHVDAFGLAAGWDVRSHMSGSDGSGNTPEKASTVIHGPTDVVENPADIIVSSPVLNVNPTDNLVVIPRKSPQSCPGSTDMSVPIHQSAEQNSSPTPSSALFSKAKQVRMTKSFSLSPEQQVKLTKSSSFSRTRRPLSIDMAEQFVAEEIHLSSCDTSFQDEDTAEAFIPLINENNQTNPNLLEDPFPLNMSGTCSGKLNDRTFGTFKAHEEMQLATSTPKRFSSQAPKPPPPKRSQTTKLSQVNDSQNTDTGSMRPLLNEDAVTTIKLEVNRSSSSISSLAKMGGISIHTNSEEKSTVAVCSRLSEEKYQSNTGPNWSRSPQSRAPPGQGGLNLVSIEPHDQARQYEADSGDDSVLFGDPFVPSTDANIRIPSGVPGVDKLPDNSPASIDVVVPAVLCNGEYNSKDKSDIKIMDESVIMETKMLNGKHNADDVLNGNSIYDHTRTSPDHKNVGLEDNVDNSSLSTSNNKENSIENMAFETQGDPSTDNSDNMNDLHFSNTAWSRFRRSIRVSKPKLPPKPSKNKNSYTISAPPPIPPKSAVVSQKYTKSTKLNTRPDLPITSTIRPLNTLNTPQVNTLNTPQALVHKSSTLPLSTHHTQPNVATRSKFYHPVSTSTLDVSTLVTSADVRPTAASRLGVSTSDVAHTSSASDQRSSLWRKWREEAAVLLGKKSKKADKPPADASMPPPKPTKIQLPTYCVGADKYDADMAAGGRCRAVVARPPLPPVLANAATRHKSVAKLTSLDDTSDTILNTSDTERDNNKATRDGGSNSARENGATECSIDPSPPHCTTPHRTTPPHCTTSLSSVVSSPPSSRGTADVATSCVKAALCDVFGSADLSAVGVASFGDSPRVGGVESAFDGEKHVGGSQRSSHKDDPSIPHIVTSCNDSSSNVTGDDVSSSSLRATCNSPLLETDIDTGKSRDLLNLAGRECTDLDDLQRDLNQLTASFRRPASGHKSNEEARREHNQQFVRSRSAFFPSAKLNLFGPGHDVDDEDCAFGSGKSSSARSSVIRRPPMASTPMAKHRGDRGEEGAAEDDVTESLSRAKSLVSVAGAAPPLPPRAEAGRAGQAMGGRAEERTRSLEHLLDDAEDVVPENTLRKSVAQRTPSEAELRVRRSLQKLDLPDWMKDSTPSQGILLKRPSKDGTPAWSSSKPWDKAGSNSSINTTGGVSKFSRYASSRSYTSPSPSTSEVSC